MSLRLGSREFADDELVVMAVVNRTRDSFYDAGATYRLGKALAAVDSAVRSGAQMVDIGGVKAGVGPEVTASEEIRRVVSLIAPVRERYPDLVISVDTWRAEVAEAALAAGADVVNDAWGGFDPDVAEVAARHGAGLVCTHAGGLTPRTEFSGIDYEDVVADIRSAVGGLAERAAGLGVPADSILIDPGHDFGKTTAYSLELTRRLDELTAAPWPVLVAVSNKDFVGETLDLPVGDRLEGTIAALAICAWHGARVFRVHNVREARCALDLVAAIRNGTIRKNGKGSGPSGAQGCELRAELT